MIFAVTSLIVSCKKEETKNVAETTIVPVRLMQAQSSESEGFVSASGRIEAENKAIISTRMMGYITKMDLKVGQRVTKGQHLISINSTDLEAKKGQIEANILQTQAAYNNAKKDYDRFVNLFGNQSASQKELDDMTARFEMAKAGLEGAKQMRNEINSQFAYTNIKSPINGVVTATFSKQGDMANPGMPLINIEGQGHLQVVAMVSESEIAMLKNNMPVTIRMKSIDKTLEGKIVEISPSALNDGGQYIVKINFSKSDAGILSGMYANVIFPVNAKQSASKTKTTVPKSALVNEGQLTGIYTMSEDSVAILRWLRLGKEFGDNVEVLSGLSGNETYIISSEGKLFNGAKVKAVI